MKKIIGILSLLALAFLARSSWALPIPVYSVNGFTCKKSGYTVTCKGPIPGGKDSVTATGHGLVYITMDVEQGGVPTRYTYFSDTGCLVGYTFGADGKAVNAVAVHRSGTKGSFDIKDENFDQMIAYCEQNLQGSPAGLNDSAAPKPKEAAQPAPAKPASSTPPVKTTSSAKPAAKPKTK